MSTQNALLDNEGLPKFSKITADQVEPAVDQVLHENRQAIESLVRDQNQYSWENFIVPLEELEDRLNRTWSPVSHMNSVVNSDPLRSAYNACLPKLSAYATEIGHNQSLFQAFNQIHASSQLDAMDHAQRKILENALRDFRLAGVALGEKDKARFKELMEKLSKLNTKFEENLLDATQAWQKNITDPVELAGLPDSAMELLAQYAKQKELPGWLINLEFPSYLPVMTYADNRQLRQEVYTAYVTRASDQGPNAGRWDNSAIMDELLAIRHEIARLLGFHNYAERSLATKMAESTEQVMQFLTELAQRSKSVAEKEFDQLKAFALQEDQLDDLQAWDIAYYSERLRRQRYAISQEDLKPYFPVSHVLQGLFSIVQRLFGIRISLKEGVDIWHPDVLFYQIENKQGEVCGQFYLDLYARAKKRGGAWMDECRSRKKFNGKLQLPVAYLTCNFTPPIADKPSLLTHDEVQTLFHEFGHGLQHMLTKIDYPAVAGISGVPWDAVELPSQFLENWCWHKEALQLFAKHFETGEVLSDELYEKMLAAKNFQSGMQMVRQLEFALFDFRLHCEYDPAKGARIQEMLKETRALVAVYEPPEFNRFANSFSHIFAGGYAAGYYSYKWAEVLSADAFSRFEEEGVFNENTGKDFLRTILEQGGSKSPMDLFVEFRGRKPNIEALLRHNGMAST